MLKGLVSNCYKKEHITPFKHCIRDYLQVRYKSLKQIFNMKEAYLQYKDNCEKFNFSFRYTNEKLNINRDFNMSRQKTDSVESFLRRIDINIDKIIDSKKKHLRKKEKSRVEDTEEKIDNIKSGNIMLLKDNTKVDLSESCVKLLEDPLNLSIIILGVPYVIKFNAPWIVNMKLPKKILANFPVYPSVFEAYYTDKSKSKFTWYKNEKERNNVWTEINEGYIYVPCNEDIGSNLKVRCLPRNDENEGPEAEIESNCTVEASPGICPFESRHAFTRTKLSGDNFRITSYNILANIYADSDYSRGVLFPYCPPYALAIDYRKLLMIKELIGYNSDIICLQEVDKKIYENDLITAFTTLNYEGVYNAKGEMSEGLAIIYNKKRFELIDNTGAVMSENIDSNKRFKSVWDKITNETARKRFLDRNTSMMVVILRSLDNPTQILIVGNTHLYFHPDADHIRLLQSYYALTICQETAAKFREKHPEYNVTFILSGDFNSTPVDGVYELMTNKYISQHHKDWSSNAAQKVENVSLAHDLSLASACGTPEYTNFTAEFADCLDYIFYETDKLKVNEVVPMPSKEELTLHTAIPSVVFPSDHIAICADMKWLCK